MFCSSVKAALALQHADRASAAPGCSTPAARAACRRAGPGRRGCETRARVPRRRPRLQLVVAWWPVVRWGGTVGLGTGVGWDE